MSYNIWLSNFARLAADEVAAGQQGFQKILRERFLSACVNNTDVSIRQFTLPSTIAETTPKLSEIEIERTSDNENDGGDNEKHAGDNEKDGGDNENSDNESDGGDNENSDNESDGGNNENSDNENNSDEDSESNQQSEDEEDEDSEAEAVIRKEAYDRLLRSQRKS